MPAAVEAKQTDLAIIATQAGMEEKSAHALVAAFMPLKARLDELCLDANLVMVKNEADEKGIQLAKDKAKLAKDLRLEVERNRKTFKENALRTGQAIDKIAALFSDRLEPVETRLKELAATKERAEADRKAKITAERALLLTQVGTDPSVYPLDVMHEDAFANLLEGATLAFKKRQQDAKDAADAAAKAEADRKAELDKQRAENDRLRAEQAAKDAAAKKEREAIEAQARKDREAAEAVARTERLARERAENELREKQAAEQKKLDDEAKAAKKAAAAPDREKLKTLARLIRNVAVPACTSPEAQAIAAKAKEWIGKLADRIEADAGTL